MNTSKSNIMKNIRIYLYIATLCIITLNAQAQSDLDIAIGTLSEGKLDKAKAHIDKVFSSDKAKQDAKSWYYKGEVYKQIVLDGMLDKPSYPNLQDDKLLFVVDEAYAKAQEHSKKEDFYHKESERAKTAIPYMASNIAVEYYQQAMQTGNESQKNDLLDKSIKYLQFAQERNKNEQNIAPDSYLCVVSLERKNYPLYEQSMEKAFTLPLEDKAKFYANYAFYFRDIKQDTAKSLQVCQEGLAKSTSSPKYYQTLKKLQIELLLALNKSDEAMPVLESALKQDPSDMDLLMNLGQIYEEKSLTDSAYVAKAIDTYKKAANLDAQHFKANLNAGAMLFNHQSIPAIQRFNQLNRKEQEDAKPNLKAGTMEALQFLEISHQLKPDHVPVMLALKSTYLAMEREDEAMAIEEKLAASEAKNNP